jgi:putative nucleotidyltransferase with HDIG domain
MDPDLFPPIFPYILSCLLSISVAIIAWRRRVVPGSGAYAFLALSQALIILGYIFELLGDDLSTKIFWDDVQWVGFLLWAILFPLFSLRFTDHALSHDYPRLALIFGVIPATFFILLVTNDLHGLIHHNEVLIPGEPFSALDYPFTPVVWIFAIYGYTLMVFALANMLVNYMQSNRMFRQQIMVIIIGIGIPLIGTVLTLFGITFTFQRDITPITFALGNVVVAWGLVSYQLFAILPIARDVVVETIDDFVFVVDRNLRLVDLNRAAHERLAPVTPQIIGHRLDALLATWIHDIDAIKDVQKGAIEVTATEGEEITHYDVHITPLFDNKNQVAGRVFVARNITHQKMLETELRRLNATLEDRVADGIRQVANAYDSTLEGWAMALELRDKETEGHSRRVTELAVQLASQMGIDPEEIIHIRRGALLHDIGKMGIPNNILNKQGSLTPEEYSVIKEHPGIGFKLLGHISYLKKALQIPYYHHERWDGSGYPEGLSGEEIPVSARLFAVVDQWDALSSDRPYRDAWPREKLLEYMQAEKGKSFDPAIVDVFLKMLNHQA